MFAVDGWNLGNVVAQTNPKKRKRKQDEKDEESPKKMLNAPRQNPFQLHVMSTQAANNEKGSKRDKKKRKQEKHSITSVENQPKKESQKEAEKFLSNLEESLDLESSVSKKSSQPALTPLQQKMRAKLSGSQFRHINEKLYTTPSADAFSLFTEQPSLFNDYHEGFRHQVQSWPTNPVDIFINLLSTSAKSKPLRVADLGCGDAALAKHFQKNKKVKVRSFDLVKVNELVEVCDMASVPLDDDSIDVAIFCLSLMGTNFLSFIREACRYTKLNGEIWIAEIKSRFLDPTFRNFIKRLGKFGLKLLDLNTNEKMFVIMRFRKESSSVQEHSGQTEDTLLKPCLYKKR